MPFFAVFEVIPQVEVWQYPMQLIKVLLISGFVMIVCGINYEPGIFPGSFIRAQDTFVNGLIGRWAFDEGEGDLAFDVSGNMNDAVLTCRGKNCSPPEWIEGVTGNAVKLDGKDDYVKILNDGSLNPSSAISITFWVKIFQQVTYQDLVTDNWNSFATRLDHGRFMVKYFFQDSTNSGEKETGFIKPKIWHHLATTFSKTRGQIKSYIDGELKAVWTGFKGQKLKQGNNNITIGIALWGDNFLKGVVDGVRIYNRVLSEKEIKKLNDFQKSI